MTRNIASEVLESLNEALADIRGEATDARSTTVHVPDQVDVKAIRERLNLTQIQFARRFGLPIDTLRKWERRQRQPDAGSRAYLTMIERNPAAVEQTLHRTA